jgi:hypothetical protein
MTSKFTYPRPEVLRMLGAFEAQIEDFKRSETGTAYEVGPLSGDRYAQFRARSGDLHALSIVVRTRVENVAGGEDPDLIQRFDRAVIEAQSLFINASLRYMGVLSTLEVLPLGAREIFTGELRSLYTAREQLRDPRLEPYLDAALRKRLAVAEQVLATIIEKAPRLLSFDQS